MISLLLATLVANPTFTIKPSYLQNYRDFPSANISIALNSNYSGNAYRYDLIDAYNYDHGTTEYKLNIGGNVFEFAIYGELNKTENDYYLTYYFATKELYHSNICFTSLYSFIEDVDHYGENVPNSNNSLPNVYFYQSNARRVTDNPIISGYEYYYGDYDDDKYYFEMPINNRYDFNELYPNLKFNIDLLPVDLVNGSEYQTGYTDGWNNGNDNGFNDGYNNGYTTGYNEAYEYYVNNGGTATEIFSGIINVALLPINFFLACLNFEVFGINIGGFVSATLTVMIVIIIYRVIVSGGLGGGKSND